MFSRGTIGNQGNIIEGYLTSPNQVIGESIGFGGKIKSDKKIFF